MSTLQFDAAEPETAVEIDQSAHHDIPEGGPLIHRRMIELLRAIGPIEKSLRVKMQTAKGEFSFSARGVDQVYNALHPVISRLGIFMTCEVVKVERATQDKVSRSVLTLRYHFHASDGSSISTEVVGEGADTQDKASNKAMSAGFKYALFQTLCIPTEAVDGDGAPPPFEPPDQKPDAPRAATRGNRREGLDALKIEWASARKQERRDVTKEQFASWAAETTGIDHAQVLDERQWTPRDYENCRRRISGGDV